MIKKDFIKKVRKNNSSYYVNIPIDIVKLLNIKESDIVNISINKENENEL